MPGWSFFVGDKIKSNGNTAFSSISLDPAGVVEYPQTLKVVLIDSLGIPYSTNIELNENREMITLNQQDFQLDKSALLPRPYPTFLPYWFEPEVDHSLNMNRLENIQLLLLPEDNSGLINETAGFDLTRIWLSP